LLNTNYEDAQTLVDKAIVIENKLKEMDKDGKRKISFWKQHQTLVTTSAKSILPGTPHRLTVDATAVEAFANAKANL
jgi:hypothetical protein